MPAHLFDRADADRFVAVCDRLADALRAGTLPPPDLRTVGQHVWSVDEQAGHALSSLLLLGNCVSDVEAGLPTMCDASVCDDRAAMSGLVAGHGGLPRAVARLREVARDVAGRLAALDRDAQATTVPVRIVKGGHLTATHDVPLATLAQHAAGGDGSHLHSHAVDLEAMRR